jgi:hypothetical protein
MPISEINIVHTVVNEHGRIFDDVIELLIDCLEGLGRKVQRSVNHFDTKKLNLVVGHTAFLNKSAFEEIVRSKCSFVIFQMEALDERMGLGPQFPDYLEFLKLAPRVWDYSSTNVAFLSAKGCGNARYMPLGYSPRLERITHALVKDFDIIFYGTANQRRGLVLESLSSRCQLRVGFGAYGNDRDQVIARSKIVLNLHQFETAQLEQVRISYLLNNRCFVVSEMSENNPYSDGLVFRNYDQIAECCLEYLRPEMEAERKRIAEMGYAKLREIPMVENIRTELDLLEKTIKS